MQTAIAFVIGIVAGWMIREVTTQSFAHLIASFRSDVATQINVVASDLTAKIKAVENKVDVALGGPRG